MPFDDIWVGILKHLRAERGEEVDFGGCRSQEHARCSAGLMGVPSPPKCHLAEPVHRSSDGNSSSCRRSSAPIQTHQTVLPGSSWWASSKRSWGKRKDAEDKPLPSPIAAIDFKSLDTLRVLRLGWRTGVGGTKYVPRYFSWIKGASGCSSSTPALQESTYSWPRSFVDIFITEFENDNESNPHKRGFENGNENTY